MKERVIVNWSRMAWAVLCLGALVIGLDALMTRVIHADRTATTILCLVSMILPTRWAVEWTGWK